MPNPWQRIEIPSFVLEWTFPVPWDDIASDARMEAAAIEVPAVAGVYAVYRIDEEDAPALHIGKSRNLRRRIVRRLVRGSGKHSAGARIRAHEDTSKLVVQWAVTDRPAAVEEELHREHEELHGTLPTYTKMT